ncbi:aminotransferase class III-fold pyridoxal phosphate-dependent enzyme [uncultured Oscillibacter sp.]|uniref:aminotransferase class III-fold pyridoxal phosphate-dependent enzyme n=2 Tax=uncultured Oscillibacter sp. TaxID=876091 RepID=UPI00261D4EAE|nr:aminotransferase class III-fold pyridoxal phosphate-dependent enzyme [uncultured Oscillibacter sp.]
MNTTMTNQDIFSKDETYVAHTYNRFPVAVQSGHGATAKDFDGKEYIDFGSGIGANSLGFCNEEWVRAVTEQLKLVQHTSNLFYTSPDALLAERLCQATGYSKVFFSNYGAEANEGAIKLARKYGRDKKGYRCNQMITLRNSFHGRTITTLAATGQDSFHQHFFPFTEGFRYVPINEQRELLDALALLDALNDSICGIMIELVQGEGGVTVMEREYAQYVEQICKERDILLIVDEVQTGIGRTGTFLCCEQYHIHPNIITLAKGLGAGLPIGAVLMDETVGEIFQPGQDALDFLPLSYIGVVCPVLFFLFSDREVRGADDEHRGAAGGDGVAMIEVLRQLTGVGIQKAVNLFVVHGVHTALLSLGDSGGLVYLLAVGRRGGAGLVVVETAHFFGPAGGGFVDGVVGGHRVQLLYRRFAGRVSARVSQGSWYSYSLFLTNFRRDFRLKCEVLFWAQKGRRAVRLCIANNSGAEISCNMLW